MHADHAGIAGIRSVKGAFSHQGIADRSIHQTGKGAHLFGRSGKHRAAAHIQVRLLRFGKKLQCFFQFFLRKPVRTFRRFRLHGGILPYRRRHILGHIHQHRPRPVGGGDPERFPDGIRKDPDILHNIAMLGDGHGHARDIHLLKGILSQRRKVHVCRDRDNRDGIHVCGGDSGDQVGRAGTAGGHADPDLSRGPGIAVRRMRRPLFMGGQHMKNLTLMLIERVVHVQNRAARITEYGIHSLLLQTFHNDFSSCKLHVHQHLSI